MLVLGDKVLVEDLRVEILLYMHRMEVLVFLLMVVEEDILVVEHKELEQ